MYLFTCLMLPNSGGFDAYGRHRTLSPFLGVQGFKSREIKDSDQGEEGQTTACFFYIRGIDQQQTPSVSKSVIRQTFSCLFCDDHIRWILPWEHELEHWRFGARRWLVFDKRCPRLYSMQRGLIFFICPRRLVGVVSAGYG